MTNTGWMRSPRGLRCPWRLLSAVALLAACTTMGKVVTGRLHEDISSIKSQPILDQPIYECTDTVFVRGVIPGAIVEVFVAGTAAPIGKDSSQQSSRVIKTTTVFKKGQLITATQNYKAYPSGPSNAVTVRLHKDDYPGDLPRPRIDPPPLYRCGLATGAADILPGADLEFISEPALAGGGVGPPVTIASMSGSGPSQWMSVSPAFGLGDQVSVRYKVCDQSSPLSHPPEVVQAPPTIIPAPTVDKPYDGQTIVIVRNVVNGAMIDVYDTDLAHHIGGSATPGGNGQQIGISPPAVASHNVFAIQTLCDASTTGPSVGVEPCTALPAPEIRPPQPKDTQVEVIECVPGTRIQVYASGKKIGDGGCPVMNLVRPLELGETVLVIVSLRDCPGVKQWEVGVGSGSQGQEPRPGGGAQGGGVGGGGGGGGGAPPPGQADCPAPGSPCTKAGKPLLPGYPYCCPPPKCWGFGYCLP